MVWCDSPAGSGEGGLKMWYDLQPAIKAVLAGRPFTNCGVGDNWTMCSSSDKSESFPELPHTSRYLLLAAFLASNNPAGTDKQFFSNVSLYIVGMVTTRLPGA